MYDHFVCISDAMAKSKIIPLEICQFFSSKVLGKRPIAIYRVTREGPK